MNPAPDATAIAGGLVLLAALLFAVPRTSPTWWHLWWRLRGPLTAALIVAACLVLASHSR